MQPERKVKWLISKTKVDNKAAKAEVSRAARVVSKADSKPRSRARAASRVGRAASKVAKEEIANRS